MPQANRKNPTFTHTHTHTQNSKLHVCMCFGICSLPLLQDCKACLFVLSSPHRGCFLSGAELIPRVVVKGRLSTSNLVAVTWLLVLVIGDSYTALRRSTISSQSSVPARDSDCVPLCGCQLTVAHFGTGCHI